jgi:hypothetical protein
LQHDRHRDNAGDDSQHGQRLGAANEPAAAPSPYEGGASTPMREKLPGQDGVRISGRIVDSTNAALDAKHPGEGVLDEILGQVPITG